MTSLTVDADGDEDGPDDDQIASVAEVRSPTVGSRIVMVTGRAGAGRTTAINTLEDLGYETVDTPPLGFVPEIVARLVEAGEAEIAIGVDSRTHGFSAFELSMAIAAVRADLEMRFGARGADGLTVLFLDCADEVLIRRYTETRRRHPLAPDGAIEDGLERDRREMGPLRDEADMVLDTSNLTAADLRRELAHRFDPRGGVRLSISVLSFAYRRGLPPEADLVFDCRFLRNPHYVAALKPLDGRDPPVAKYVSEDARYAPFMTSIEDFAELMLPAYRAEGKSYLTIAFGCTGGQHRSVAVAEAFAATLRRRGWALNIRHRERPAATEPAPSSAPDSQCDDAA